MNIAEANAWNTVLRSLETGASEDTQRSGVLAAEYLAGRARASLKAGPVGPQVASLVEDVHNAVEVALWDESSAVVRLPGRPVETTQPAGGVL